MDAPPNPLSACPSNALPACPPNPLPTSHEREERGRETTRHEEKLLQCDSCFARFNASMTAIDPRSDPFKSSPLKLRKANSIACSPNRGRHEKTEDKLETLPKRGDSFGRGVEGLEAVRCTNGKEGAHHCIGY
ncbi:hypothetical protein Prudu_191S000400 [Prunus dulcis]|uniref:Uncharacterized protein n=1 Tax=Prunus dulcis TaxID=3755 RepID=A0A5H2XKK7_PRUDU|nr:hypothetical protein Prudu_191S000400 [Prunus dulcis]